MSVMKELCLLLLICWAGTVQCLAGSLMGKIPGKQQECEQAKFVPGYNLAGEGFDIVKMQRKGSYVIDMENWEREGDTCELGVNFYLGGVKQKLPAAMANWRAITDCKREVSSSIYESSESLINTTTSAVTNNWKLGLDLAMNGVKVKTVIGGTDSREATYAIAKSKQDRYSFTRHEVHCSIYRYSLVEDPPLHKQFLISVKKLPTVYDLNTKPAYRNLIDTYGTHFTSQVNLGGKVSAITSIKSCQATMNGLTVTEVKDCLDVEASLSYQFSASLTAELHYCNKLKKKLGTNQSFSSMFSDRQSEIKGGIVNGGDLLFSGALDANTYKEWLESLKTVPDVVHFSLKPLHFLLKSEHPAQPGLKKAVEEYILENALIKKCSESCQIGTRTSKRDHCACVCNSDQSIKSNCCPAGKGLARLQVYGLRAKGLYGDISTKTDGFVEISYDKQVKLTEMIKDDDDPVWPESFEFGPIHINFATKLTFKVYDTDRIVWNKDVLGECSFDLRRGNVSDVCVFQYGTFFFSYTVQCAPSLGGSRCEEYIPSPMSASLAKVFHSRNGMLAGEKWRLELGRNPTNDAADKFGLKRCYGE
ncbi:perforin-1 isoform X1 [Salmo trutta]|uniref:Perforin 1.7 n=2 Tax=Salmo trutta TaxID=8032 RepID=A0A673YIW9_SALTR|nr:perforin-1-like isoform X1 [Salmo trutta]